jgi:hypothetical protein
MANEKIVSQIELPNGDIYDIAPPAITDDEIDAICGNTNIETWQFTMTDGSITEK